MVEVQISSELETLIPKFLMNRKEEAEQIIKLVKEEKYNDVKSIAHKIKGVSGGYGFEQLTVLGGAIEDCALTCEKVKILNFAEQILEYLNGIKITYIEEEF